MTGPGGGRLALDVASLLRWTGPPVGIARVEAALAAEAARRPDALPVAFDPGGGEFRTLAPRWASTLLGFSGAVEPPLPPDPRRGWRRIVPSRLPLVSALERVRLSPARPAAAARLAGLAQAGLLALRPHAYPWRDGAGRRIANVPAAEAFGPPAALGPRDVVLLAGAHWASGDASALADARRRRGFALAAFCYDLIPITHPGFFPAADAAAFRAHWRALLPALDLVVANARSVAEDVRSFCAAEGLPPPRTVVRPLGFDPPAAASSPEGALSAGLRPGRFALFVSTIEPRKGHALLLRAWRRLLARGIPQAAGFDLVFVGRRGWMVDDVLAELAAPPPRLRHLAAVDDAALDGLHRACAFGLYPSVTEGFGLPLIEAFARGKPVIASAGGALPETARGRAPCLDPADEAAWEETIAAWIADPAEPARWAARVAAAPPDPTWPEAAAAILDEVAALRRAAP